MKQFFRREDGMMLVEGMLALLATIMVLICLLGFGFLFYQQWAVCNIANDTATRIAQTYAYTDTDPVMGYINESQIRRKPLLRYYRFGQIEKRNADRGEKYARWSLKTSSLASASSAPEIQVETKHDALARRHVEVRIEATYEIPFGGVLELFGIPGTVTYHGLGEAVCVDPSDYINTVDTYKALTDLTFGSKTLKAINSFSGMVQKIFDLFQ